MHTRKLAIPTGIAVAVITAVAPAAAAQAHGNDGGPRASASSFGHGHGGHGSRGHVHGVRGEVKSYDSDTGKLVVSTSSDDSITATVTKRTKVWIDDDGDKGRNGRMSAASVRALCHDDDADDQSRSDALAALKAGADVKVALSSSGALKAVEIDKS